jgi:hypothetical protein
MIINLRLNDIIPNIIEKHHDKYVLNYFENGFSHFLEKHQRLWIKNKMNFLITCQIYTKPFLEQSKLYAISNI